jgi:membrane protein YdbS with pleckstrin-like domain
MATIDEYPIEQSKILKNTLGVFVSIISTLGLSFILFSTFFIYVFKTFFYLVLILIGLFILGVYFYNYLYYKRYYYDLQKDFILIREGVITYSEVTLPYYRIQDVYIDQDPLDQLFGLYALHIATASGQSLINAHIDGLNYQNAQKIKGEILKRLKIKK